MLSNKSRRKLDVNVVDLEASHLFKDNDTECDYENAGLILFCSLIN